MLGRYAALLIRRLALSALVALIVLAVPALALAASGQWQSVDLTLVGSAAGKPVLLVAGRLPDGAKLPAKVTLTIPPGGKIGWAGEVLGADPSKDLEVQYKVQSGKEFDTASFTLTKSRIGQVEVDLPGAYATNGGTNQAKFSWTAPYKIPTANLRIQMPSGAKVTSGTPGGQLVSSGPSPVYESIVKPVSKGQLLALAVAYTGGTYGASPVAPATPTQRAGSSPVVIAGALALLLAITYFALKRLATESGGEVDYEEPDQSDERDIELDSDGDSEAFVVDESAANSAKPAKRVPPRTSPPAHRPRKRSR